MSTPTSFKNISPSNRKPAKKLFVNHFGYRTISEEFMKTHFSQFGSVVEVSNRGCAFVEFSTTEAATKAFEATRNSKILGKDISVRYSQTDVVERDGLSARQNFQISRNPTLRLLVQALWDWENCGIPRWFSRNGGVERMVHMIRQALLNVNYDLSRIDGYGDPSSLGVVNYIKLQNSGVVLHDVIALTQEQKERGEADTQTRQAMTSWMISQNPPSPVLLMTSDSDYVTTIRKMQARGFEVFVAYIPQESRPELMTAGDKAWSWWRLIEGKSPYY